MIPTPTPLPPPISTMPSLGFDTGNFTQEFAYGAVQFWNTMPSDGITALQVFIVLVLVMGGIGLIIRAVRSLDAEA